MEWAGEVLGWAEAEFQRYTEYTLNRQEEASGMQSVEWDNTMSIDSDNDAPVGSSELTAQLKKLAVMDGSSKFGKTLFARSRR